MSAPLEPLMKELEQLHSASFAWAMSCCSWKREEAEDVLQVAYLEILDGRARFEGRSTFKTWLFSVIRRTASSRRRRGILRGMLLDRWAASEAPLKDPPETPDSAAETGSRGGRIRATLAGLSERQRQVLDLTFFHELTVEEAAGVMGVTIGTARVHYDRGKKELKKRLQAEGIEP